MNMTSEQIQALKAPCAILRSMALNYAAGHQWDPLDGEAVTKAANYIDALLAERDADKALIAEQAKRIDELEAWRVDAAKQILSWRRLAKQSIEEYEKAVNTLDVARQRIAELDVIRYAAEKLVRCKGRYHSEQNYRALAALFGVSAPDLPPLDSEARTLTVKLPEGYKPHVQKGGTQSTSYRAVMSGKGPWIHRDMLIEACAAAGITLAVGE